MSTLIHLHDVLVCCSEISWLINETWSLGRKHAQAQRDAEAFPLMAAAISLMDLCDEFSDSKEVQLLPHLMLP